MQCTSYNPAYYRPGDLNIGESGLSWQLFHSNANYGKETGYNISLPLSTMDQYLAYDKEVLRQIIQNQEATFRHQVQELHRLYRRQRELTDDMRVREIFRQQLLSESSESSLLLSQTRTEISAAAPHTTSWLLGDHSHSKMSMQPSAFVAKNFQVPTNLSNDPLTRKNIYHELESISSRGGGPEKRILDLQLPADMYGDNEFEKKLPEIHPASNSDTESASKLKSRKANVLIDLNEPVQLESMASNSETCPMEVIPDDLHYLRGPGNKKLPVAIDLNSLPLSYSEMETTIIDDGKFLEVKTPVDLSTGTFTDEPSPPPSSTSTTGIRDLAGPTSPENKECLPPRGKSEDSIQLETPLDIIGAETLLMISSSEKFMKSLCWFAEIVSSTGDDLENEIMKLSSHATGSDHNDGNARKGHARATRQPLVVNGWTDLQTGEGFLKTGAKRNAGKTACAKKPRKNSKLSHSVAAKKSTSSFKKKPGSCSKHGALLSWGMTRQRQGGRRRRASKSFFDIS